VGCLQCLRLFPIDQSREAREAAEVVANVVQKYGSRLVLLSVLEEVVDSEESPSAEVMAADAVAQLLKNAQSLFTGEFNLKPLSGRQTRLCDL